MDLSKYKKVEHPDGRIEFIPLETFVKLSSINRKKYATRYTEGSIEIICKDSLLGILNVDVRKNDDDLILVTGHKYELVPIEPYKEIAPPHDEQPNQRFKVKFKR